MYECSEKCSDCGGDVEWDFTCHTYPQTNTTCPINDFSHSIKWNGGNPSCLDCNLDATIKTTWMACMPCDSATEYRCVAHNGDKCDLDCYEYGYHEGCGWRWVNGLNKGNPRAIDNETRNPHWND